ncbi:uncharacterized protein STAUR_6645 [Stigmatella aurantiaca DW4/3-1]|uniref:Uncharacterized protein n=1 Tax=Stigmatella aurantiaca (strain DW4/3-1) TaxID=378806 RepID=Q09C06_STIAD|nr:uncharacterized protein STAUR_6645 [Stigmatella aurantiaca DW4/3-1]EAU69286.1 hypothetical protein STIAU_8032 [Stigmatella aurantiaca DW4/3-1]
MPLDRSVPEALEGVSSSVKAPPRGCGALLFLLVLVALLPGAGASVLRAALGLPLWVGALVGLWGAAVGVGGALARQSIWPTHRGLALLQVLFLAVVAGVTWRMLGIPVMDGLVSVGGGDAGNHAALRMDFVTHEPGTYQGFTLFHTVTYGLGWLFGLDTFSSFRAGFYLVPAVLAGVLAASLEFAVGRLWRSSRACAVAQGALLAATVIVWPFLLLRLLHYHQADGFYGHLFGLVPLVLAWAAYALPRAAWARCAALAVFTVLYRYTYGLNLGDFLLMGGVLALVEGFSSFGREHRRLAWLARLMGLAFLAASAFAYGKLLPLAPVYGSLIHHDPVRALRTQGWCVVGLLVLRFFSPRGEAVERRLIDFALVFGGVNALVQLAYLKAGLPVGYYFLKYSFHAVVLLLCAGLLVASIRVGSLVQAAPVRRRGWRVALAVLVAAGLAAVTRGWSRAFAAYSPSYQERVRGQPPFALLSALEDRAGSALIRQVLRDEGKRLGGLLSPSWARVNFSNVALGWVPENFTATNGHWPLFSEGRVRRAPGACVFWEAAPEDWEDYHQHAVEGLPALEAQVRALHAEPGRTCRQYPVRWAQRGTRTLCFHCD